MPNYHVYPHNFYPLRNVIQNYPWGSTTAMHELFSIDNPTHQPQAELWMGTHPNGCSRVQIGGQEHSLAALIAQNSAGILSPQTLEDFGELPFLFKILSAEKALSVQVHPSKGEAQKGYALEEGKGIAPQAAHRNYKDPNHKPELVYALTTYQAMNGFRNLQQIAALFAAIDFSVPSCQAIEKLVIAYQQQCDSAGLQTFFSALLSLQGADKDAALDALLAHALREHRLMESSLTENAQQLPDALNQTDIFELILTLAQQYPGDIGLFSPLLLNVVTLAPGQAMYLDARTPHAYIKGTGLEIMANSDNVLRAGLTNKFIDVPELVACTQFEEKPMRTMLLTPHKEGEVWHYDIPVPDFGFTVYQSAVQTLVHSQSAEIILALDDTVQLTHANGETLTLQKGESAFIPAYAYYYSVTSSGRIARVFNQ
ncbi:Mannose-6-phosphate isomerase [Vibrio stylophorae]|uniref:mannose-6-phosphate isomerase n=1 Tax=Vibrio stylophorae TaxID=659351 RepID=A0ABM8ZR34_9VIBR|nr:mannose-6-phosphate isomerase, class I [Vibrio stylophorae]CAH0532763.1 Mannose-6-phosphate isomerase [Vibrio stylophorae]